MQTTLKERYPMKYLACFLFFPLYAFAQEDKDYLLSPLTFQHENQLAKTAETIKESAKVDLSSLAILPFLNDNVKKLEKLLVEKDNLLREKDAEILRLIQVNNQIAIEKKECEVDFKHCKNGNYLQLGVSGLATVATVVTSFVCYPSNPN
jgi:hypothetical protein